MKRKVILSLLMAVAAIGAQAQTKMTIHHSTEKDYEIFLMDKPVVTYEGSNLVVKGVGIDLTFPVYLLEKITFSDSETAVEEISVLKKNDGPSNVYDFNGNLVKTVPVNEPVETSTLPSGTYIVKNNNTSYKISKK